MIEFEVEGDVMPGDLDYILMVARETWPKAIVEDSDGEWMGTIENTLEFRIGVPYRTRGVWNPKEAFIFEDREAYLVWTREGYTESHGPKMIQLFVGLDWIEFDVADRESAAGQIVQRILPGIPLARVRQAKTAREIEDRRVEDEAAYKAQIIAEYENHEVTTFEEEVLWRRRFQIFCMIVAILGAVSVLSSRWK